MIVVEFVNDKTGSDEVGNYFVRVFVNGQFIESVRVTGHPRHEHWTGLLARCAAQNNPLAGEAWERELGRLNALPVNSEPLAPVRTTRGEPYEIFSRRADAHYMARFQHLAQFHSNKSGEV